MLINCLIVILFLSFLVDAKLVFSLLLALNGKKIFIVEADDEEEKKKKGNPKILQQMIHYIKFNAVKCIEI